MSGGFEAWHTTTGGGGSSSPSYGTPVTSAGSLTLSQAGGTAITSAYTVITSGGGNVAATLPSTATVGQEFLVELSGAEAGLLLFPELGSAIGGLSANAYYFFSTVSLSQTSKAVVSVVKTSATTWRVVANPVGQVVSSGTEEYTLTGRHYALNTFYGGVTLTIGNLLLNTGAAANFGGNVGFTFPAALTPGGTTQTVNWANGASQIVDASSTTGTLVLTSSNPVSGGRYVLKCIGKTGRVWTMPSSQWAGGVKPTVTAVDGAVDIFHFVYDGTTLYGSIFAQNCS